MNKSKVLRNNFLEGVGDAFNIIYGNHNILYKTSGEKRHGDFRLGAADLFIFPLIASGMVEFGLPMQLIEGSLHRYCVDEKRAANPLRITIGYLGTLLQLPRITFAGCLTALVIPIILVVHAIKYPYVKYLENKFFQLKGEIKNTDPRITNANDLNQEVDLGSFVNRTHSRLNDLKRKNERDITSYSDGNDIPYTGMYSYLATVSPRLFFKTAENNDTPSQIQALEAGRTLGILN